MEAPRYRTFSNLILIASAIVIARSSAIPAMQPRDMDTPMEDSLLVSYDTEAFYGITLLMPYIIEIRILLDLYSHLQQLGKSYFSSMA